jgi:hypothetical protein
MTDFGFSKTPDLWKLMCSSCRYVAFFWDEKKKYKDRRHISILSKILRSWTPCPVCARQMRPTPSSLIQIEMYAERERMMVMKEKIQKMRVFGGKQNE